MVHKSTASSEVVPSNVSVKQYDEEKKEAAVNDDGAVPSRRNQTDKRKQFSKSRFKPRLKQKRE